MCAYNSDDYKNRYNSPNNDEYEPSKKIEDTIPERKPLGLYELLRDCLGFFKEEIENTTDEAVTFMYESFLREVFTVLASNNRDDLAERLLGNDSEKRIEDITDSYKLVSTLKALKEVYYLPDRNYNNTSDIIIEKLVSLSVDYFNTLDSTARMPVSKGLLLILNQYVKLPEDSVLVNALIGESEYFDDESKINPTKALMSKPLFFTQDEEPEINFDTQTLKKHIPYFITVQTGEEVKEYIIRTKEGRLTIREESDEDKELK